MSHDENAGPHGHGHGSFEQQPDRLPGKIILTVVAVTSLVMLIFVFIAWGMLDAAEHELRPAGFAAEENLGRPHRVQGVHQGIFDLETTATQLAAPKREALAGYGWVDKGTGTVHIPVERAMDLFVASAKTLPAQPADAPAPAAPSPSPAPVR